MAQPCKNPPGAELDDKLRRAGSEASYAHPKPKKEAEVSCLAHHGSPCVTIRRTFVAGGPAPPSTHPPALGPGRLSMCCFWVGTGRGAGRTLYALTSEPELHDFGFLDHKCTGHIDIKSVQSSPTSSAWVPTMCVRVGPWQCA